MNEQLTQFIELIELRKNYLMIFILILLTTGGFLGCNASNNSLNNKPKANNVGSLTSVNDTDSLLFFREQILNLVSQGNTKEAIKLLAKSGDATIELLQARFDRSNTDYEMGIIDFKTWDIEQNRINYTILELIPEKQWALGQISIEELNKHINEGNTEEALNLLVAAGNEDAILWKASFVRAKKQFTKGLIDSESYNLVNNRLQYAIKNYLEMNKKNEIEKITMHSCQPRLTLARKAQRWAGLTGVPTLCNIKKKKL